MALDFPAFAQAMWSLYAKTGIRPEYVLPVLYSESGFSTTITNGINCIGINQACPNAMPIPAGYASWTASEQMNGLVTPMYQNIVSSFGPINSGTRAYQANFLPATLATATSLSSVLAVKGSVTFVPHSQLTQAAVYSANSGLDYQHTGEIRVSDLAHFIARAVNTSAVQNAISQTYSVVPTGVGPMQDPVYGTDFSFSPGGLFSMNTLGAVVLGAGLIGGSVLAYKYIVPGAKVGWGSRAHGRIRQYAMSNPASRIPGRGHSNVQALLFSRRAGWTPSKAKSWARSHGYRTGDMDVTDNYVHLTQSRARGRVRTKSFGRGIRARLSFA
jgi:hypothetical protein